MLFAVRGMVAMQRVRELRPSIGNFTVCTIKQRMAITAAIHSLVLTKDGAGACVHTQLDSLKAIHNILHVLFISSNI